MRTSAIAILAACSGTYAGQSSVDAPVVAIDAPAQPPGAPAIPHPTGTCPAIANGDVTFAPAGIPPRKVGLGQAQLATGAKDAASLGNGGVGVGGAVAIGVGLGQMGFRKVGLAEQILEGRFGQDNHALSPDGSIFGFERFSRHKRPSGVRSSRQ